MIGAVGWILQSQTTVETGALSSLTFGLAFGVVTLGVVAAVVFFRQRRQQATTVDEAGKLNLVGWALGEAVALFGFVGFLLLGTLTYYLVGFLLFLATFLAFPIPEESP